MSSLFFATQGTKLFSAGTAGLVANLQWTTWVRSSHPATSHLNPNLNMYARADALGGPGARITDVVRPHHGSQFTSPDGSCMLEMHYSAGVDGPWTSYPNATISPCGSNNPAPWILPNGTVYIVFTDQNM